MNINSLIGTKLDQTQGFLENGKRIPLTTISVSGNRITQIKNPETDHYMAIQLGFGDKKKVNKATAGHIKKAGLKNTPRFFREVRVDDTVGFELGQAINIAEMLEPGDVIDVTGTSKGKGYAGVVKRHHFKGGPRTHGQSDRERAPGSSGQTTTPGRVYKGKRMSGRMGDETVTVKNLIVIDIKDGVLYVKGLIPGVKGALVMVSKVKEDKRSKATKKKFVPLFKVATEEVSEAASAEAMAAEAGPVIETVEVEALPEVVVEEKSENSEDQNVSEPESHTVSDSEKSEEPIKSEEKAEKKEEGKE